MVDTDIGQNIASRSWFHHLCVYLTILITAKSADSGARILLDAALRPKEKHVSAIVTCEHRHHVLFFFNHREPGKIEEWKFC